MRTSHSLLVVPLFILLGCNDGSKPSAPAASSGGFGAYSATPTAPVSSPEEDAKKHADRFKPPLPEFPLPDPNEPPSLVVVDDCMEGSRLRESKYAMSRGVGAIKDTELKALLEWQIPHALELKKAENGKYPPTWEAFKRDILDFNQLKLPTLRPGYEFWYDAENGKLMKRPEAVPDDTGSPTAVTDDSATDDAAKGAPAA